MVVESGSGPGSGPGSVPVATVIAKSDLDRDRDIVGGDVGGDVGVDGVVVVARRRRGGGGRDSVDVDDVDVDVVPVTDDCSDAMVVIWGYLKHLMRHAAWNSWPQAVTATTCWVLSSDSRQMQHSRDDSEDDDDGFDGRING